MEDLQDSYKILGVKKNSNSQTIRKAYLKKLKEFHPDVYTGDKNFALEQTSLINQAYDNIKNYGTAFSVSNNTESQNNINLNKKSFFQIFCDDMQFISKKLTESIKRFMYKLKNNVVETSKKQEQKFKTVKIKKVSESKIIKEQKIISVKEKHPSKTKMLPLAKVIICMFCIIIVLGVILIVV